MEGVAREPYLSAIHRCVVHRGSLVKMPEDWTSRGKRIVRSPRFCDTPSGGPPVKRAPSVYTVGARWTRKNWMNRDSMWDSARGNTKRTGTVRVGEEIVAGRGGGSNSTSVLSNDLRAGSYRVGGGGRSGSRFIAVWQQESSQRPR